MPVVFGVQDATVSGLRGAIEAVVALADHKMDETDMTMDEMREEVESRIKYKHSYIFSRMKMKETKKHYAFDMNVSHGEVTC